MKKNIFIVALISLIIDQITKRIASTYLKLNSSVIVINNFFKLTLCHNDGVAWGMLDNKRWLILIITMIAIVVIYFFTRSFKKNMRNGIAFGLIYGGLFGNLIDRVGFGYVRDFLDFYIFKYDFPVFNVADMCIVIGVILLIIAIFKGEEVNENSSRESKW